MCKGIIICLEESKRCRSICLLYKEGSDLYGFCPPHNTQSNFFVTSKEFWLGIFLSELK